MVWDFLHVKTYKNKFKRGLYITEGLDMERKLLLATLTILLIYASLFLEPICTVGVASVKAEIKEPARGVFLRGEVNITIELGGYGLHKAYLYIDKELVKTLDSLGVHKFSWNTKAYTDGSHIIRLVAYDKEGRYVEDHVEVFVDNTPPLLGTPVWSPKEPSGRDDVVVSINVTDETSGVLNVTLHFGIPLWAAHTVKMTFKDGAWRATIPRQSSGSVEFYIVAYDAAGNRASTKTYTYTIKVEVPDLPAEYIITAILLAASFTLLAVYLVKFTKTKPTA